MRNDWILYTTQDGISSIRNLELDEKNYYRMKIFMRNYFKDRFADNVKKPSSLIYTLVMNMSAVKEGTLETPFLCNVNVDQRKIALSWTDYTGVCVTANTKDGNTVIKELYTVLKGNVDNEFWKICL